MQLLADTDAFCKLAISGLFHDAVALLGADITQCGRLPALPYMLQKGRLRTTYGPAACDNLIALALTMPVLEQPDESWLDKLAPVHAIDVGEAQIFAMGADTGRLVMTGDKRALIALSDVADFPEAMTGRIVVMEAILIALCDRFGREEIRRRTQVLAASDKMVQICFSTSNPDPRDGLLSYFRGLKVEVEPLVLWDPRPEDIA